MKTRAEGREQTLRSVQIYPPSVRAETINVIKAALAIVLMVAAYHFPAVVCLTISQSPITPIAIRAAPVSAVDQGRSAERAARIPGAAGRSPRSRAYPRADRPLARCRGTRGPGHPAVRARSDAEDRVQRGRRYGRTGRPITWVCRPIDLSPPGCWSSSNRSRGCRPIPLPMTRRITGLRTAPRCTCRSGICPRKSAAAASPR